MQQIENGTSRQNATRIAIVGIGCRLPGNVQSADDTWQLLKAGKDALETPTPRYTTQGARGMLADVAGFDRRFFGISPREATMLDPQHRLLLEVAFEAFEDAGVSPARRTTSNTAVYVALQSDDYAALRQRSTQSP